MSSSCSFCRYATRTTASFLLLSQFLDATICIFWSLLNELLDGLLSDLDDALHLGRVTGLQLLDLVYG